MKGKLFSSSFFFSGTKRVKKRDENKNENRLEKQRIE